MLRRNICTNIDGNEIKRNSKTYISMKVTTDLDGGDICVPVHVIAGSKPGPTLALLSTLHGSEWLPIEMFRRLIQKTEPHSLAGTLILVPVGNPVAFGNYLTRMTPDQSDMVDLNRAFPGEWDWIAEQLASKIAKEVLANSGYMIDFHWGIWGSTLGTVLIGTDYPSADVVKRSWEMGKSFGYPCLQKGKVMSVFPGPKSSIGYFGGVLEKPCIAVEIGGAGFGEATEEKWIEMNINGVNNVMKHIQMLKGSPALPEKYLVWSKRWRAYPKIAGILVPKVPADSLMREVAEGELLGQIVSPYSFEVLQELRSPGKGVLFGSARMYPVRPGDWSYPIIDLEDKDTKWIPGR